MTKGHISVNLLILLTVLKSISLSPTPLQDLNSPSISSTGKQDLISVNLIPTFEVFKVPKSDWMRQNSKFSES